MTLFRSAVAVLGTVLTVACSDGQPETALPPPRVLPLPSGRIDSIIPVHDAVRRFVEGLPVVTELRGGAPTRDSLVTAFLAAVDRRDSRALAALAVTQAEYGYLYYPSSVYARKPYELSPDIAWMLNRQNSEKAIGRIVDRLGGRGLELDIYDCGEAVGEGANRIWTNCVISYRDRSNSNVAARLPVGPVIERNGRFKLLAYRSDF